MTEPTNELREKLAAYAHEAWSGWMNYQFSKAALNDDGTWTMPAYFVERWHRQMTTSYDDLPESEKASDRDEADKMIEIIESVWLASAGKTEGAIMILDEAHKGAGE